MKNLSLGIELIFLIFIQYVCLPLSAEDKGAYVENGVKETQHPTWVLDRGFFSEEDQTIRFSGFENQASEIQWKHWKKNIPNLSYHSKVKAIFMNYGYISENEMEYFSGFENIESVTLGHSIEGVLVSLDAMSLLAKFHRLAHLNISIHGLSDRHLAALSKISSLKYLTIEFPSVHMLVGNPSGMERWNPANLTETAALEISKIKSLSVLMIYRGPSPVAVKRVDCF